MSYFGDATADGVVIHFCRRTPRMEIPAIQKAIKKMTLLISEVSSDFVIKNVLPSCLALYANALIMSLNLLFFLLFSVNSEKLDR